MPTDPVPPVEATPTAAETLDARKATILSAIVAEYVKHAEPVGSKRVVEVAELDVSAATVRNEMGALEEAGFIGQPHTSAGRIPTDKGYRYFVDELAEAPEPDAHQRAVIQEVLGSSRDLEELLHRTTQVLSRVTSLVSLVVAPALDRARLKKLELVSLHQHAVLVLFVTDTGRVEKRLVELTAPISEDDVERTRTALNRTVQGRRLGEVEELLAASLDESPKELRDLTQAVAEAAHDIERPAIERVFVGGQAALAGVGALERDQLSRVLELLEERMTLAKVLAEDTPEDSPLVRIGGEHAVEDLHATSLVAQRYRLLSAGSLGVLGPTRMDYAAVLSTVRAVADALHRTLNDFDEDDRG